MKRKLIILMCLGLLSVSVKAQDVITWMIHRGYSPIHIESGDLANQGPGDIAVHLIISSLPEYKHRLIWADTPRILNQLMNNDGVCFFGAIKTPEREKYMAFTNRPMIGPSLKIISLKGNDEALDKYKNLDKKIDLKKLSGNTDLRGAYVLGYPFPDAIEKFVKDPKWATRLDGIPSNKQIISMVMAKRIDFSFGYSVVAKYDMPSNFDDYPLSFTGISGIPSYVENFIACSAQPKGREIVTRLDQLFADDLFWGKLVEPYGRWYEREDFEAFLHSR